MKKLMFIIFLIAIIGCGDKQIEIKEITQTTCRDCSAVISSDTTTVVGLYNKTYKVLNTPEGRVCPVKILPNGQKIATQYKSSFCEECKKKRRVEAKKLFKEGKRKYWAGRYEEALDKFESATMRLSFECYAEADEWIEKTKTKIYSEKALKEEKTYAEPTRTTTKRKSAGFYKREEYARIYEGNVSDMRPIMRMQVTEDTNLLISQMGITYQTAQRYYYAMLREGIISYMRELGFTSLTFMDLYTLRLYHYTL